MKIYTEIVYTWDDNKGELVEESSKSYEYEGEITKCDYRANEKCDWFGNCIDVPIIHSHTSLDDVKDDVLDLTEDVIGSVTKGSTFGYWDFEWDDLKGSVWNSSFGEGLYAFGDFLNRDLLNFLKYPADSLSANETGDGSLNQFRKNWKDYWKDVSQKRTDYIRDLNGKYHDLLGDLKESIFPDFSELFGDGGGTLDTTTTDKKVKGPGKMRGRDPSLAFNMGAKGFGRSSLKIGSQGSHLIGGKFKTYRTGRRAEY